MNLGIMLLRGVALAAALTPAAARAADPPPLHLTLATEDGQPPTDVCIITEAAAPEALRQGTNARARTLQSLEPLLCDANGRCGDQPIAALTGKSVYVSLTTNQNMVKDSTSLAHLATEENEHRCAYDGVNCTPFFSFRGIAALNEDTTITCAENLAADPGRPNATGSGHGRVLVLGLSSQITGAFSAVQITELKLNGHQALIKVSHDVRKVDLVLSVLGGFYAPLGEVRFTGTNPDRDLRIEARCRWTTFEIPRIVPLPQQEPKVESSDTGGDAGDTDIRIHLQVAPTKAHEEKTDTATSGASTTASTQNTGTQACRSGSLQSNELRLLIPYEPKGQKQLTIAGGAVESTEKRSDKKQLTISGGAVESTEQRSDKKPPTSAAQARWVLETSWSGPRPVGDGRGRTDRPKLDVRTLSFSWRADRCLYPQGTCPTAKIASSGLECRAYAPELDEDGLCHYRCTADEGSTIDFPTKIAFTRATSQAPPSSSGGQTAKNQDVYLSWVIDINQVEQQLAGYVDPAERAFEFDTDEWHEPTRDNGHPFRAYPCELNRTKQQRRRCRDARQKAQQQPRDQQKRHEDLRNAICPAWPQRDEIFAIEFSSGRQILQRVEIDSILKCSSDREPEERSAPSDSAPPSPVIVKLPHVSCNEPIRYRYIGTRDYFADSVKVVNGAVKVPHPMKTARMTYYSVALLPAAFQFVLGPKTLREERPGVLYAPAAEASVIFRPRGHGVRGWRFNIDLTVFGAIRPFVGVNDTLGRPIFVHWLPGFSFLTPWLGGRHREHFTDMAVAFGAGVQVGLEHPLHRDDTTALGRVTGPLAAARADIRLRLSRRFELMLSPRVIAADHFVRFTTDFHGQPTKTTQRNLVSILIPLGIAAIW